MHVQKRSDLICVESKSNLKLMSPDDRELNLADLQPDLINKILSLVGKCDELFRCSGINKSIRFFALNMIAALAIENPKLFLFASQYGNIAAMKYILARKPELNKTTNIFDRNALHVAALFGKYHVVQYIVREHICDVEFMDDHLDTPLALAAKNGYTNIVELLVIQGGADVNTKDNENSTPLHNAAAANSPAMLQCLIKLGADTTMKDNFNETALDVAVRNNCQAAVQCLLNLSFNEVQWIRAMDIAGYECNEAVITILLQASQLLIVGVVSSTARIQGLERAFFSAMYTGLYEKQRLSDALKVMRTLVQYDGGLDVNAVDWLGTSPLMRLAVAKPERAAIQMATMLLDAGARVDIKDELDVSVLDHAVTAQNMELAGVLRGAAAVEM